MRRVLPMIGAEGAIVYGILVCFVSDINICRIRYARHCDNVPFVKGEGEGESSSGH